MKKTKKLVSILLAFVMAFALMTPMAVSAADGNTRDNPREVTQGQFNSLAEGLANGRVQLATGAEIELHGFVSSVDLPRVDGVDLTQARSLADGLASGNVQMAHDAATNRSLARMAGLVTFEFNGSLVELDLSALGSPLDAVEINAGDFNLLTENTQVTIVSASEASYSADDVEANSINCWLFGCRVVPGFWAIFNGVLVLVFVCVVCGAWWI